MNALRGARHAVGEVVREDRRNRGPTLVNPSVGGEARAARAVEAEVGVEGSTES